MQARRKASKTIQRERHLVFAAIAVFMTCAVLAPVLLAMLSGRPDLYAVKTRPVRPGVSVVDWRTLDSLLSRVADPAAARPGWFGPEVQIAGYMIPVGPAKARETGSIRPTCMPERRSMSG
jgi:hypothetical protein